jgi:hypothetical protein
LERFRTCSTGRESACGALVTTAAFRRPGVKLSSLQFEG